MTGIKLRFFLLSVLGSILGSVLIYIGAQFELSLPGTSVPQSGQTLAVIAVAALLPKYYGVLAVVLYLSAGLLGLPVFSGGGNGWSHLSGTTGGYLFGFLVAAIWVCRYDQKRHMLGSLLHYLLAHAIILGLGCLWLSRFAGMDAAWTHGVSPFLSGALVKSVLTVLIVYGYKKLYQDGKQPLSEI